ncbi:hypothetical protein EON67_10480, partial [archaeon]
TSASAACKRVCVAPSRAKYSLSLADDCCTTCKGVPDGAVPTHARNAMRWG